MEPGSSNLPLQSLSTTSRPFRRIPGTTQLLCLRPMICNPEHPPTPFHPMRAGNAWHIGSVTTCNDPGPHEESHGPISNPTCSQRIQPGHPGPRGPDTRETHQGTGFPLEVGSGEQRGEGQADVGAERSWGWGIGQGDSVQCRKHGPGMERHHRILDQLGP